MSADFFRLLLEHYHLTQKDLSERCSPRSFSSLKRPDGLKGYDSLIARIRKAIADKEKTVIYGDYDVDGLTATAILKMTLDTLGLKPGYFVPSRYQEGYGLNGDRVAQFAEKGYRLIITVDNGITAFDAIDKAHDLGMEVLVIDHHSAADRIPPVEGLFHQSLTGFLDYNCSAASLCYFVSSTLLGKDEPYYATLAGLAVFSDVMPLIGNNLTMATIALRSLKTYQYRNLVALMKNPSLPATYHDMTFSIIPVLNAVGRIRTDSMATIYACRYLMAPGDDATVRKLLPYLLSCNDEKKQASKAAQIEDKSLLSSQHAQALIAKGPSGISGLIASRFMKEADKATLLLLEDEKNPENLVGSIRTPEGYDCTGLLTMVKKYLIAGGGHPQALGITIRRKDYFQVATLFVTLMEGQAFGRRKASDAIEIVFEDLTEENYQVLSRFEPFGQGFEEPVFRLTLDRGMFSLNDARTCFSCQRGESKAVYFGKPEGYEDPSVTAFTLTGSFTKETFRGKTTYSLVADDIESVRD